MTIGEFFDRTEAMGYRLTHIECEACRGRGQWGPWECTLCDGTGWIELRAAEDVEQEALRGQE